MEATTAEPADPALAYRVEGACRALGISRSHLYREIAAGRIEARKAGAITLIPAAAATAWLSSLPSLKAAA